MKKIFLLCLFSGIVTFLSAQKYTISGYVTDIENGEKLIGANVYDANNYKGSITNSYGFFSLTLDGGKVLFTTSYVGYTPYQKELNLTGDSKLNIELKPTIELKEVIVQGKSSEGGVESSQMSLIEIPMKTIQNLPVLLGEADIIKTIQLLPGVQSGSEGMSGMYVRGGGPDQNLILLDGVPVYNVNHLFGFFSVFNSDAIHDVKLIKGGFPSRYGGRLSSVLDISMKEGNSKEFKGSGSIGLISSKLTIEGPVGQNASFIVSARRTYIDVLAYPFIKMVEKSEGYDKFYAGYYFYDLNGKINYKLSDKNRLYLSVYTGKDRLYSIEKDTYTSGFYDENNNYYESSTTYKDEVELWWGNITSALRWNYMLTNKLFSNVTLTYSRYKMLTGAEYSVTGEKADKMNYNSGISDWGGKIDFDYYPTPNHSIKFGIGDTYHGFNPGVFVETYRASDSNYVSNELGNSKIFAHELALYAEDDIKIGELLKLNVGLHWSGFLVKDKFYDAFEPRISARVLLSEKWSVKVSMAQMQQYINLLANSNIGLPTDLWVPATDKIKPQMATQYALGSEYSLNRNIDLSVEGFYKVMDNLVEYKEGASFFSLENDWESKIALGKGWSYGIELLVMKKYGNTSGWIGYTWSKSERLFDKPGQEISYGKVFPYKYDRRHDLSIVISHKLSEKVDFGVTWVFGTGNAATLGYEKYPSNFQSNRLYDPYYTGIYADITYYESRNNFRMPAYHRLDVGINFHKDKKWGKRTWNLSIYNVYNHKNPFYVDWGYDEKDKTNKLYQYSIFPIIPAISYKFEF